MRKSYAIAAAAGTACAALLLTGAAAEAQGSRRPLNPVSLTIGSEPGMRCVRFELDGVARSRNPRRRLVQIECPSVLGPRIEPINDDGPIISLHLTPSEAACLLRILNRDPRPNPVALRQCNIPLERAR